MLVRGGVGVGGGVGRRGGGLTASSAASRSRRCCLLARAAMAEGETCDIEINGCTSVGPS